MPGEAGKTDMERIGLFSEMEYITVGDKYVSPFNRPFNEAASKNRQMLPGGSKEMSNLQAGYFDSQFTRIFEGEGYVNLNQVRRRYMMAESKKNLGKAFIPSNGDKKPSGLGSYYGTVGGPVPFFSAQLRPRDKYKPPGKNLYTNPGKKGTGYGYANVTIGKQLSHSSDLYDAAKLNYKKDNEEHHRLLKGSPFKLNLHPKDYFDNNPYFLENPLPPLRREEKKGNIIRPFKPSSPGKKRNSGSWMLKGAQRQLHPLPQGAFLEQNGAQLLARSCWKVTWECEEARQGDSGLQHPRWPPEGALVSGRDTDSVSGAGGGS